MRSEKINGKDVVLYDSIHEMPITNFQQYNMYLLMDAEIGSTIADVDMHYDRLLGMIRVGNYETLEAELLNYKQNLHFILMKVDLKLKSFLALLYKVNGKFVNHSDEAEVEEIGKDLLKRKLSFGQVVEVLNEIKKK